jgi:hypothetical protein
VQESTGAGIKAKNYSTDKSYLRMEFYTKITIQSTKTFTARMLVAAHPAQIKQRGRPDKKKKFLTGLS